MSPELKISYRPTNGACIQERRNFEVTSLKELERVLRDAEEDLFDLELYVTGLFGEPKTLVVKRKSEED